MSIESEVSLDGKKLTIAIKGRFDFSSHQTFRDSSGESNRRRPQKWQIELIDQVT